MKILFDGCDFLSRTGPNSFAKRLAFELLSMGHIIADPHDYDVVLVFIEPSFRDYSAPVVQRLDGIWFSPEEFKSKNVKIKSCYDIADRVIWQSEFDRSMTTKWWGDRKGDVIRNGILIDPILDTKKISNEILQIRNAHDMVFCASANWHGQKRLKQNIELFRHLKKNFYPSSCLIVLGSNPEKVSGSDIYYTGNVSHAICEQIYAISHWMIHLAYLDHCPNSVLEALMQGTPVICSDQGGTKELVRDYGLFVKEPQYNYELVHYDDPPLIDVTQVSLLPEITSLGSHCDIDIKNVAEQYIKLFNEVINETNHGV